MFVVLAAKLLKIEEVIRAPSQSPVLKKGAEVLTVFGLNTELSTEKLETVEFRR